MLLMQEFLNSALEKAVRQRAKEKNVSIAITQEFELAKKSDEAKLAGKALAEEKIL